MTTQHLILGTASTARALAATLVLFLTCLSTHADTVLAGDTRDGWRKEKWGYATGGKDARRLTATATARCVAAGGHRSHIEASPVLTPKANGLIGPTAIAFGRAGSRTWTAIASGKTYAQAQASAIAILRYKKCTAWCIADTFEAKP